MGQAPRTVLYDRPPLLKSVDAAAWTASAVLTYPCVDYQGDYVEPAGGVWPAVVPVNWDHDIPVGTGRVAFKSVDIDGTPHRLPVGTTTFFKSAAALRGRDLKGYAPRDVLDASRQGFRLVADGVADGVSIEFYPKPGKYERIGKSLLAGRPAYRFYEYEPVAYAHTPHPVCPSARTLLPAVEKALKLARDGRFPGGERLCPLIAKSLSRRLPAPPPLVRGGFAPETKAMPADATADEFETTPAGPAAEDAPADDLDAGTGGDTTPTAKAAYDCAQGVLDLKAMVEASLKGGEHVKGKQKLKKLLADLDAVAEEASAIGDMVTGDVSDEPVETPDAGDGDDPTPEALSTDDDGGLQTKSLYKPRRFRFAGPDALEEATPAEPEDGSAYLTEMRKGLARAARDRKQARRSLAPNHRR